LPNEQNENQAMPPADNRQKTAKGKGRARLKRLFYAVIIAAAISVAAFASLLKFDLVSGFLDDRVQAALQKKIGGFADVNIANTRLSLDNNYHIALEMTDIPVVPHDGAIELSRLGRLRFGLATMPLLRRHIQPVQLEVDQAAVIVHKNEESPGLLAALPQDSRQRIDFNAVTELVFLSLEKAIKKIDATSIHNFHFSNMDFTIKSPKGEQKFSVQQLRLRRLQQTADIEASLLWLGQTIAIKASAALDNEGRVENFTAAADNLPLRLGAADNETPYLAHGRTKSSFFRLRGAANIRINGTLAANGKKQLAAGVNLVDTHSDIAVETAIPTRFDLTAGYEQGSGQIMLQPSLLAIGGLKIPFTGHFGPLPPAEAGQDTKQADPAAADTGKGQYSLAIKAENAESSPADSPAEVLSFSLDTGGRFSALEKKLSLDNFSLQTEKAALLGNGSLRFGSQGFPETIFILHTEAMPIDEAKQLWPINIARGGRAWVLSHIFGGNLRNMQIEIALPEGFYQKGKLPPLLSEKELRLTTMLDNTRADLVGTLPPLREAYGQINLKGRNTVINLGKALAYVEDGRPIHVANGQMSFTWRPGEPLWADMTANIDATVGAAGKLLECRPVNAAQKVPFNMQKAKGELQTRLSLHFPLHKITGTQSAQAIVWSTDIQFRDFSLGEPFRGMQIANAAGRAQIDQKRAQIDGTALLNAIPATVSVLYPLNGAAPPAAGPAEPVAKKEQLIFRFDDKLRHKLFPALDIFLQGAIAANVGEEQAGRRPVRVDLSKAVVQIPWIGWKKGSGIAAKAEMSLPANGDLKNMDINDFVLSGPNFQISGKIKIRDGNFVSADFAKFALNRGDRLALAVTRNAKTYQVRLGGQVFDMRALIKNMAESAAADNSSGSAVVLTGAVDTVQGFYGENLHNFRVIYNRSLNGDNTLMVNAVSKAQVPLKAQISRQKGLQRLDIVSDDAGAFLRFMNYYDKVQGGRLESRLQSGHSGVLNGPMRIHNFAIVNEPKLAALVSADKSKGKKGRLNGSYLAIDQAYGRLTKGPDYLTIDNGVIRGASLGATFQGVVYDAGGNIAVTGTYMPAYSVNRIFGDVPLLGSVLGNGRDKGLIGITFKVEGKFKSPKVVVNPVSALAPGILRSIFEFKQP